MTIAITLPMSGPTVDEVSWRALRTGLWVARRDGRHLGTLEQGRRWLASDADGEPIGAFRSFREAQVAVAEPAAHRVPLRESVTGAPAFAVAALVLAGIASAASWTWIALAL
jgi:hypothetical protein